MLSLEYLSFRRRYHESHVDDNPVKSERIPPSTTPPESSFRAPEVLARHIGTMVSLTVRDSPLNRSDVLLLHLIQSDYVRPGWWILRLYWTRHADLDRNSVGTHLTESQVMP